LSYRVVVVVELDIPWAQPITPHKFFVSWWTLVLGIASQHTLDAHADALHVLDRTPALLAQKIETDEAVGVDMGMHRNWPVRELDKCDLWRFYVLV
jgi:hypothetical protein